MAVLNSFDQPCSRVGFMIIDGKKEWTLHPLHKRKIKYPYKINGQVCEREVERRQKYIDRNYLNLECDCEQSSVFLPNYYRRRDISCCPCMEEQSPKKRLRMERHMKEIK
jgi:hypothetical protein